MFIATRLSGAYKLGGIEIRDRCKHPYFPFIRGKTSFWTSRNSRTLWTYLVPPRSIGPLRTTISPVRSSSFRTSAKTATIMVALPFIRPSRVRKDQRVRQEGPLFGRLRLLDSCPYCWRGRFSIFRCRVVVLRVISSGAPLSIFLAS